MREQESVNPPTVFKSFEGVKHPAETTLKKLLQWRQVHLIFFDVSALSHGLIF